MKQIILSTVLFLASCRQPAQTVNPSTGFLEGIAD
jgi:hypothetical protein